jgi:hypothetical protein
MGAAEETVVIADIVVFVFKSDGIMLFAEIILQWPPAVRTMSSFKPPG